MSMRNLRRGMSIVLSFALILSTMVLRPKSIQASAVLTSLANPGFEEPVVNGKIPGWSALFSTTNENLKFELTNEKSASGNYSIKVYDNLRTASTGIISDPVSVIPGKTYTGRTKLYISNNTNVASLNLRFYDANNIQILQSEIHNDGPKGFPAAQWVDVATPEKIAPANAKYARLLAYVTGYSIATAYYDDMAITYEDANMTNSANLSVPETVAPGQEFTVTLGVAEAVYQASADIQFDSQKLQLIEVKGAGDFANEAATVTSEVLNGNIKINASLNKTEAGSGTAIAALKFKATGMDGSTWIKLNKNTTLNGSSYILLDKNYNIAIIKPQIPNILANPGYEEPIAGSAIPGWSSVFSQTGVDYKYEITNTQKASGNYSLKITDQRRDQSVAIISDSLAAIPGAAYTGKAKMLLENNSTASLNIRFYDADNKQIAEEAQHFETSKGFPVNQWADAETETIVAPDNAKFVRFMAYTTSYAIAVAYYDDMAISYVVDNTPAKLDLSAPVTISEGQEIVVQLNATELKNLYAVNAKIYYDKQKLQFVKVVPAGPFAGDAAIFTSVNDSIAGKLFIETEMKDSGVLNTDTIVADITFKVTGSNGEAWVILDKESTLNAAFNPPSDKACLLRIGAYQGVKLSDVEFGEPEALGAPIADTVGLFDGAAGMEDGQPVMYTTVKGIPPMFHVVSLNDYKLLRSIPLTGAGDSWSHRIAPDGTVYTAAGSQLWAYSPVTKTAQMVFTYPGENVFWAIDTDEVGNVYIATGPSSKVLKYNPVTKQGTDYGRMLAEGNQVYARSIAYGKGYVYVGTSNAEIYKLNVTTGEKVEIGAPLNETGYVYDTDVIDDKYLIVRYEKSTTRYIYNIETGQWLDVKIPNSTSGLHIAKQSLNSKIYMPVGGKIVTFDVNNYTIEETGMVYGSGFRGSDWVEVSDPDLPGKSLVTMNFAGKIVFFNPQTKTVKVYENILPPSASITHVFETVPDGNIVITGMQASKASVYNVFTDKNTLIPMGQAGTVIPYDGKIYFGVYPGAEFYVYDPKLIPSSTNPRKLFNIGDEQSRPITGVVGDEKIYVGSIPDYGKLGGAITVFDPAASDPATAYKNFRNIVQDQSIISLTYKDGKIYGGTSINGGLSTDATAKEAKLFVWDTVKEEKITEINLEIPGLVNPKAIGGLTIGPDGLLWGGVNGIVFAMDPGTMKLIKYKNLYPQDGSWGQWGSYNAKWSQDGLLYMFLGRRLTVIQPDTLEFKYFVDSEAFTLGEDENIYYSPRDNRTLMNRIIVKTKRPANLSLTTPSVVAEDGEFNVTLKADQVLDLHKVNASISYDPEKLQFVSAKAAGAFDSAGVTFTAENMNGIVRVSAKQAGNDVVNADTNVAILTFKAIGNAGESTVLKLNKESEVAFADGVSFRQYFMFREQEVSVRILSADSTFIVKPGSIDHTAGIKVSVNIKRNPDGPVHDGNEVVVFQLMKKDDIVSVVAVEQNIDKEETFTAFFTVPNPKNHLYQVKVFVTEGYSFDEASSINLSNQVILD